MGCLLEEIWCMLTKHKFEIRGSMVYEPLIPIYGLAALLITLIANRVGYNLWKVFILGSISFNNLFFEFPICFNRVFE